MKEFIQTFAIVSILLLIFVFFGGYILFDFSGHFWLAVLSTAFTASVFIYVLSRQSEKIDELEKRIKMLEETENGAD